MQKEQDQFSNQRLSHVMNKLLWSDDKLSVVTLLLLLLNPGIALYGHIRLGRLKHSLP